MISEYFDTIEDLSKAIDVALEAEREIKKIIKNDPRFSAQREENDRIIKNLRWQKKTFIKEYKDNKERPEIQP